MFYKVNTIKVKVDPLKLITCPKFSKTQVQFAIISSSEKFEKLLSDTFPALLKCILGLVFKFSTCSSNLCISCNLCT